MPRHLLWNIQLCACTRPFREFNTYAIKIISWPNMEEHKHILCICMNMYHKFKDHISQSKGVNILDLYTYPIGNFPFTPKPFIGCVNSL